MITTTINYSEMVAYGDLRPGSSTVAPWFSTRHPRTSATKKGPPRSLGEAGERRPGRAIADAERAAGLAMPLCNIVFFLLQIRYYYMDIRWYKHTYLNSTSWGLNTNCHISLHLGCLVDDMTWSILNGGYNPTATRHWGTTLCMFWLGRDATGEGKLSNKEWRPPPNGTSDRDLIGKPTNQYSIVAS